MHDRKLPKIIYISYFSCVLFLGSSCGISRSNEAIRDSILSKTPQGSSREDVIRYLESKSLGPGFNGFPRWLPPSDHKISALLGCYNRFVVIGDTCVLAYWNFGSDWLLIDVVVRKHVDSI